MAVGPGRAESVLMLPLSTPPRLIPVMAYVLARAQMPRLVAELRFVRRPS